MKNSPLKLKHSRGIALIEVLVAAAVLAFGLIGLGVLHVSITQANTEARSASVATQIATENMEDIRSFVNFGEYQALDNDEAPTRTDQGTVYSITRAVERWRYNNDPDGNPGTADAAFEVVGNTEVLPTNVPEFKQVTVTVSWTNQAGEDKRVALTDAISSAVPTDGLAIVRRLNGERINPQIRIKENTETGVIPIAIGTDDAGSDIASASSNPRPRQYAEGATGTTKFTVDTYIKDAPNPLLQRQLDFAFASCVCKKSSTNSTKLNPAYAPTYWDGLKYVSPKQVIGKPMGERDTSIDQDPSLCDTCCRDHHDELSAAIKADPFRTSSDYASSGDHNHYKQGSTVGSLVQAGSTDSYLEACRMVRVDGIYSVATDARLENNTVIRLENQGGAAYLPQTTAAAYADFAKAYVESAFARRKENTSYPVGGLPDALKDKDNPLLPSALASDYELADGDDYTPGLIDLDRDNKVSIPRATEAYLNARGLYIDWLSPAALEKIECIGDENKIKCIPYKDMDLLELLPFVAVNLTQLAMWDTDNASAAVVRNDPIPLVRLNGGGNASTDFVRGKVTTVSTGTANVSATIQRSNSGLVNTKAIDPEEVTDLKNDAEEYVVASSSPGPTSAPFQVNVNNQTADGNFSIQSVSLVMSSPTMVQPSCAVGSKPQTINERYCLLTSSSEPLELTFGNYNYYSCSHLGSKWVFDVVKVKCVLPATGKNGVPQYADPQVRDFQMCSLSVTGGNYQFSSISVVDGSKVTERSVVSVARTGARTLLAELVAGNTPVFTATFAKTCN